MYVIAKDQLEQKIQLGSRKKDRLRRELSLRNHLIVKNRPLAVNIANKIHKTCPHLPLEDLISAGVIGLITAIDKHDSTKATLSTFAHPHISGAINREIRDKWQTIRMNRSHYDIQNKLRKAESIEDTDEAIANRLEITVDKLWKAQKSIHSKVIPIPEDKTTGEILESRIINDESGNSDSFAPIEYLPALPTEVVALFDLICAEEKIMATAIAIRMRVSPNHIWGLLNQLLRVGLIVHVDDCIEPNLNKIVLHGIKRKVAQKVEIVNFLDRLQKLVEMKAEAAKMEKELVAVGGDRVTKILKTMEKSAN